VFKYGNNTLIRSRPVELD